MHFIKDSSLNIIGFVQISGQTESILEGRLTRADFCQVERYSPFYKAAVCEVLAQSFSTLGVRYLRWIKRYLLDRFFCTRKR